MKEKRYFRCTICGDLHYGNDAPKVCPTCGYGRDKAIEISKQEFLKLIK